MYVSFSRLYRGERKVANCYCVYTQPNVGCYILRVFSPQ
nr:MAG TPA: hypothetical protein [Caudoviricetes sp.]